jgi:hypothetical protein
MHQLQSCGITVELLRVKEPQEVTRQSGKVARRKHEGQCKKSERSSASNNVKPSLLATAPVIVISSDDDVFEK